MGSLSKRFDLYIVQAVEPQYGCGLMDVYLAVEITVGVQVQKPK